MTYLITYETAHKGGYPESIVVHDIPQWLKDNPQSYITVCTPLQAPFKVSKADLKAMINKTNTRASRIG